MRLTGFDILIVEIPMKISVEMVLEEFQSLALAQSQMSERLATLENRLARLGRENQEIREMLARR